MFSYQNNSQQQNHKDNNQNNNTPSGFCLYRDKTSQTPVAEALQPKLRTFCLPYKFTHPPHCIREFRVGVFNAPFEILEHPMQSRESAL